MNSFELLANWLYQVSIIDKKKLVVLNKWKVMFALDLTGLDSEDMSTVGALPDGTGHEKGRRGHKKPG